MIGTNKMQMIGKLFLIALLAFSCGINIERDINLRLNDSANGWYFVRIRIDRTNGLKGDIDLSFDDNERFKKVFVNDAKGIIFHVYDQTGKDISKRMEHVALGATDTPHYFFRFYFPKASEEQSELFYPDSSNEHYYDVTQAGSRLMDSLKHTNFW